ncbi:hypothetical protein BN3590_00439 [Clostridium sp. C105KSO15]|nr:hypothetical protein BN3590_00439 [Clostridium sp. C105KSO15]
MNRNEIQKMSFESKNEFLFYMKSIEDIGLWNSEKVIFLKYLKKDDNILDLGCGIGRTTFNLYNLGFTNIIGIDYSSLYIEPVSYTHLTLPTIYSV